MNKNRKLRVSGLENIALLLGRTDALPAAPAPKGSKEAIVAKTLSGLHTGDMKRQIEAAVREAFNLGHAEAFDQGNRVEALLEKQYAARTELTMPAVVAAVMEQLGMSTMQLELDTLATVFTRCRIEYEHDEPAGYNVISYKLHHLADVVPQ